MFGIVVEFEKNKRLLERNDKGQGKATGINITVGKKIVLHGPGSDSWRMQVWKKNKKKFESPGKCYRWNPEKKW